MSCNRILLLRPWTTYGYLLLDQAWGLAVLPVSRSCRWYTGVEADRRIMTSLLVYLPTPAFRIREITTRIYLHADMSEIAQHADDVSC